MNPLEWADQVQRQLYHKLPVAAEDTLTVAAELQRTKQSIEVQSLAFGSSVARIWEKLQLPLTLYATQIGVHRRRLESS